MNRNLRDRLFSYLIPLVERHISSEMTYIKILAYLKLLKMVCVSLLEVDVSKIRDEIWKMNLYSCTWFLMACASMPIPAHGFITFPTSSISLKKLKIPMGYCWKFLLPIYKLPVFKKVDCFNKFIVADALPKTMQVNVQSDVFIVFEKVLKY